MCLKPLKQKPVRAYTISGFWSVIIALHNGMAERGLKVCGFYVTLSQIDSMAFQKIHHCAKPQNMDCYLGGFYNLNHCYSNNYMYICI